ncbi:MAG: exodeoxyribonuclease VII large subunit [Parvularculaceae bacterium]
MPASSTDNVHEYSVSELAGAVKRAIEDGFGFVRVRGELGRVTRAASGHVYLDLKDDKAALSGVMWKGMAARLTVRPEQGMEVVATGKLTTFPGQSKYQLIIDSLEPAGAGALMALLEDRKKKLAAEGLFDPARKKPLPFLPEVIGVVTSPSGAVIRDILHRLRDRFPRRVIVWPTLVQGRGAEAQIVMAIEGFNALKADGVIPRPDVLIVARGGGSLEDLWCFNEEAVARAAAASAIPLISAVGHETDTTLIDYVADRRAPTPTAAAEIAVPVRSELLSEVLNKHRRMLSSQARSFAERRTRIQSAARGLGRPEDYLGAITQRVDRLSERLRSSLRSLASLAETRLARSAARFGLRALAAGAARREARLSGLADRLAGVRPGLLARRRDRLERASALLRTLSYQGVLDRGFALVKTADGSLARRAADLPAAGAVTITFSDASRRADLQAEKKKAGAPPAAKKGLASGAEKPAAQKTLFD